MTGFVYLTKIVIKKSKDSKDKETISGLDLLTRKDLRCLELWFYSYRKCRADKHVEIVCS